MVKCQVQIWYLQMTFSHFKCPVLNNLYFEIRVCTKICIAYTYIHKKFTEIFKFKTSDQNLVSYFKNWCSK